MTTPFTCLFLQCSFPFFFFFWFPLFDFSTLARAFPPRPSNIAQTTQRPPGFFYRRAPFFFHPAKIVAFLSRGGTATSPRSPAVGLGNSLPFFPGWVFFLFPVRLVTGESATHTGFSLRPANPKREGSQALRGAGRCGNLVSSSLLF